MLAVGFGVALATGLLNVLGHYAVPAFAPARGSILRVAVMQLDSIAPERVLELRFEDLLRDPHPQLERIVQFLGLELTPEYRAAIASLQLRPVQARWGRDWNDQQLECVLRETQPLLRQLGYTR